MLTAGVELDHGSPTLAANTDTNVPCRLRTVPAPMPPFGGSATCCGWGAARQTATPATEVDATWRVTEVTVLLDTLNMSISLGGAAVQSHGIGPFAAVPWRTLRRA